ncbi:MAG: phosphoribosylamine--glycine ligase [Gammaproteobacteria bacterium]|nr:MAG: phosphoribosylamine--glycine ligase [Gammaproteobacteria bacterium]
MKILVVGSGGREHALAWKAARSAGVDHVFVAPGNAGTAREPNVSNVDIAVGDFAGLAAFVRSEGVDLTIAGPENPLVDGIRDYFDVQHLPLFGPSKGAAQLEGSKSFTKDFLARHGIPTAAYQTFTDLDPALEYIDVQGAPIVIKGDGLAAGKAVVVAHTVDEARAAVRGMLSGASFGDAGRKVVIEEFLDGEEASFICLCDGVRALPFASSQDHKARDDGDLGPNTGGMGAYSPAPVVTAEVHARIMREVVEPTIAGMAAEGHPYQGFLYAGLMIMPDGSLKVIEFNCRFGDPEAQPVLMRLRSDLVALCQAALAGGLDQVELDWDPRAALGVVLAAGGYPLEYAKGDVISGLDVVESDDVKVFHAGSRMEGDDVVTSGGRVLCVVGLGDDVSSAQRVAYRAVAELDWRNIYCRRDIGYRAVARELA